MVQLRWEQFDYGADDLAWSEWHAEGTGPFRRCYLVRQIHKPEHDPPDPWFVGAYSNPEHDSPYIDCGGLFNSLEEAMAAAQREENDGAKDIQPADVDIEAALEAVGERLDADELAIARRMQLEYGAAATYGDLIGEIVLALAIHRRQRR